MTQDRWEHDISVHTLKELQAVGKKFGLEPGDDPVVLCDERGVCYFDEHPDPSMAALKSILDERGASGWQLVQIDYGKDRLVCTWRRILRSSKTVFP
jgi:hypothetical protein